MITLIERASEAAKQALLDDPETDAWIGVDDHFDALVVDGTIRLSPVVRAILLAMREPSEGMAELAFRNGACGGHEDCWRAMIDAALSEKPE